MGWQSFFVAQKQRHRLKERGQEVGIQHFNLDRLVPRSIPPSCAVDDEALWLRRIGSSL